jgi:hypothetical protein
VLARFIPCRWWAAWPPIPAPRRDYMRFRSLTMYGHSGEVAARDLVDYLAWCKRMTSRAE